MQRALGWCGRWVGDGTRRSCRSSIGSAGLLPGCRVGVDARPSHCQPKRSQGICPKDSTKSFRFGSARTVESLWSWVARRAMYDCCCFWDLSSNKHSAAHRPAHCPALATSAAGPGSTQSRDPLCGWCACLRAILASLLRIAPHSRRSAYLRKRRAGLRHFLPSMTSRAIRIE